MNNNRQEFIDLLNKVSREGANIKALIAKLDSSDFFNAPASAKNFNSFKGGLVDHCLCTYHNLNSLVKSKHLEDKIDEDSIIICGLLHDISKMNYYTETIKNEKVYFENGSKYDDLGRYEWVSKKGYVTKPEEDRFMYGNREETSEFIIRQYIPLKYEESMAILHHLGGKGFDSNDMSLCLMWKKHPLVLLLHIADELATYIDSYYE